MTIKDYYKQILNEVLDNPIKRLSYMVKAGKSLHGMKNIDKRIRRLDKMALVADRGIIFRKKQINEIGDTYRGREFLHYYIRQRRPQMNQKTQEVTKLSQAANKMRTQIKTARASGSPEEIERSNKQGNALLKYLNRKSRELAKIHKGMENALDRLGY